MRSNTSLVEVSAYPPPGFGNRGSSSGRGGEFGHHEIRPKLAASDGTVALDDGDPREEGRAEGCYALTLDLDRPRVCRHEPSGLGGGAVGEDRQLRRRHEGGEDPRRHDEEAQADDEPRGERTHAHARSRAHEL
jgi:hypothetical protein